jgi:hypothetical protein
MAGENGSQISELGERLKQGRMSRREFLRAASLLGLSLGAGELLAACSAQSGGAGGGTPTPTFNPLFNLDDDVPTMEADPNWWKPAPTFTPQPKAEWTGKFAPTATPSGPKIPEWYCEADGKHFFSLDMFLNHAASEHTWRLPKIQQVDTPTYAQFIVQPLERFDERNTVFSRTDLDAEDQARRNAAPLKKIVYVAETQEGQALMAGAIYVDNKAGTLHEKYSGYFAHIRGAGGLYDWDEPVNPAQYPVSDQAMMSARVKEVARMYGANLVGITRLDQRWVYSNWFERATQKSGILEVNKKFAIVLAIEMNSSLINQSPGLESSAEVALAYSRMAEIAASLAAYIRGLGYAATPHGNDTTQSIPLAIDAGLGEFGRMAC